ncbi:helix-turn-helix domain-containing protein [Salipiger abyssi]|uniref:helix-turn-helix domain-containing protein n=1 Tax=Salipiger abyssi TaxID=1250539 RepID=UPI004058222D
MTEGLGQKIRAERDRRGWSLTDLAERSAVSRAMINRIERGESSPTASVLGRLSGAFGLTMSELLAAPAQAATRLSRAGDPARLWQDPETGYLRERIAAPAGEGRGLDIVRVTLPPGARVDFPPEAYSFLMQSVWVLSGRLLFEEGETRWQLGPDDCLTLGAPQRCAFVNPGQEACVYAVVIARV